MNAGPVTPAVQQWAERGRPGAQVTGYTRHPLEGGAVARSVDQVTLHLTGGYAPLELVRKEAPRPRDRRPARRSARDTEAALDRIEQALADLPS